jgi:hypothetical protein
MARRELGRGLVVVILVTSGTISLLFMVFMFLLPIVLYLTTEIFSLPHSGHGRYSISLLTIFLLPLPSCYHFRFSYHYSLRCYF